ncbi:MAG: efflux RND transporter periplasmic adaptor subunit [Bacteroidales bacterium]
MNKIAVFCLCLFGLGAASACHRTIGEYDATGTFEATEVVVSAEVQGEILSLDAEEGENVSLGQFVGVIDSVQLVLQRQQLIASNRAVNTRSIDIGKQIAALQEQIRKQQREKERFQNLFEHHAATQKQVDDIDTQLQVLQKQLNAQLTTLGQNNRGVKDESESVVLQIARLSDMIAKCRIKAPVAGMIMTKYAQAGEYAMPGTPLFKIANMKSPFLRVYVTSDQLAGLQLNQSVEVVADFGKDNIRTYQGSIVWIGDKSEFTPKGIQTKNERANLVYPIKIRIQNDGYVKIGMYGGVHFSK